MQSIFERMRQDHRGVLEEIDALEKAVARGAGGDSQGVLERVTALLSHQFGSHMAAEDDVLYPALMDALPETRPSIEPLRADHGVLRMMLADLEEAMRQEPGEMRDEQIVVQVRDLVDLLRIHIRKEEAVVIGVAERVLRPAEVEALAARMARGTRSTPHAPSPDAGPAKGARS